MLGSAGDEEVRGDGRGGVRVDLGSEVEGARDLGGGRGPQLEGLVEGGREEGELVEGEEG